MTQIPGKFLQSRLGLATMLIGLIAVACSSAVADEPAVGPTATPDDSNARASVIFDEEYTAPFELLTPSGAREIDPDEYREATEVDNILPIYDPKIVSASEVDLFPDELVIGVDINGESRAYPHRLMQFREMANDVVGGQPILVSW